MTPNLTISSSLHLEYKSLDPRDRRRYEEKAKENQKEFRRCLDKWREENDGLESMLELELAEKRLRFLNDIRMELKKNEG